VCVALNECFDLHFAPPDAGSLIPVYLGLYYFAGRKANFRETLALAPPGTTIAPTQSAKLANARTRSNRLRPGYSSVPTLIGTTRLSC
jgi:hypothetical protein